MSILADIESGIKHGNAKLFLFFLTQTNFFHIFFVESGKNIYICNRLSQSIVIMSVKR